MTTAEEARVALDAGADLLGLNFHPPSPRRLTVERAAEIVRAVDASRPRGRGDGGGGENGEPRWIGVFVDRPAAEVDATARRVGLDLVQLHGDETPADVAPLAPRAIKAFRVERSLDEIDLEPWLALDLWGFLVDARAPDVHGGSGRRWDVATFPGSPLAERRTFVAGGLTPETVADAVRTACPWGVDVCSGVERAESTDRPSPAAAGLKDPRRIRALFAALSSLHFPSLDQERPHHGTSPSAA